MYDEDQAIRIKVMISLADRGKKCINHSQLARGVCIGESLKFLIKLDCRFTNNFFCLRYPKQKSYYCTISRQKVHHNMHLLILSRSLFLSFCMHVKVMTLYYVSCPVL